MGFSKGICGGRDVTGCGFIKSLSLEGKIVLGVCDGRSDMIVGANGTVRGAPLVGFNVVVVGIRVCAGGRGDGSYAG
jgi:hypothetical protein